MSLRISIIIDGTGKIRKLLILILYYVSMTIKPTKLNLLSYSTEYGLLGEHQLKTPWIKDNPFKEKKQEI